MNDNSAAPSDSPSDSSGGAYVRRPGARNQWRRLCWGVIVIGYLFVGYAWLGPGDLDRNDRGYLVFWYVAFLARTFQFHAGIVFALLTAACLIARWKRRALATVPILLATLGPSLHYYIPRTTRSPAAETFRVMSANLLYLNEEYQPIIDEILEVEPDLLLLQEYTDRWHKAMQPAISEVYPHAVWVTRSDAFGLAIYAKQPMEADPRRQLDCGEITFPLLRALVAVNGQRIAFYSIHMVPPTWRNLPLVRRQFKALSERLTSDAKPIVLAGDFNFTGDSYMHRAVGGLGLADAHQTAGWGRGDTWPKAGLLRFLPGIRIDHVYLSEGLTAVRCRVGKGRHSDHRPIIVDVAVPVRPPGGKAIRTRLPGTEVPGNDRAPSGRKEGGPDSKPVSVT